MCEKNCRINETYRSSRNELRKVGGGPEALPSSCAGRSRDRRPGGRLWTDGIGRSGSPRGSERTVPPRRPALPGDVGGFYVPRAHESLLPVSRSGAQERRLSSRWVDAPHQGVRAPGTLEAQRSSQLVPVVCSLPRRSPRAGVSSPRGPLPRPAGSARVNAARAPQGNRTRRPRRGTADARAPGPDPWARHFPWSTAVYFERGGPSGRAGPAVPGAEVPLPGAPCVGGGGRCPTPDGRCSP